LIAREAVENNPETAIFVEEMDMEDWSVGHEEPIRAFSFPWSLCRAGPATIAVLVHAGFVVVSAEPEAGVQSNGREEG
jgi:hypothetical protein